MEKGIKIALGSASKNAPTILNRIGMDKYFHAVIDGNKVDNAKPDPEVFLKAASDLGLKPEECVVFEDAQAGIEAALKGGMHAIGIGSPDILKDADMVISSFEGFSLDQIIK
jgi:beta-phosphoglucomutase